CSFLRLGTPDSVHLHSFPTRRSSDLIVDGEAGAGDWHAFRSMAEREPSLWRELAEYQRDQSELSAVVASAIRIADDVEAPVHEEDRKSTRLNSSHLGKSYAVFCLIKN